MHIKHKNDVLLRRGSSTLIKIFICTVMSMTLILTSALTSVQNIYGYTAVRATVVVKSGKVRKDAKLDSPFVFGVTKDEIVTVIGEKKGDDGALWYQIKVLDSTGYIRSDLVKKSNIEVKSESTIEITDDNSNSNSATENNTNVQNTETDNHRNAAEPVELVRVAQNEMGVVKGSNVIVRASATTKSNMLLLVQNGQVVEIVESQNGDDGKVWYHVNLSFGNRNYNGYIRSDLVNVTVDRDTVQIPTDPDKKKAEIEEDKYEETTPTNETPAAQVGKIRGMGVNIRKEPVSGKVLARLNTGHQITVIDQVRGQADQNIWCKINFIYEKTPMTGYVRSDFTEGIVLHVPGEPTDKEPDNKDNDGDGNGDNDNNQPPANNDQNGKTASIKGTGVRIRETAVNGNIICQLDTGYPVTIIDEVEGSDGMKWYKIEFSKNDKQRVGFVRSDLVNIVESSYVDNPSDEEFENQIAEFPNDYKASLRALHEKYPNWQFIPVNTGLDWNNVVAAETVVGKNLVSKSSVASWKSTAPQAYNWATNTWYGFDGGSWAAASPELIKYYLDPRNFLDDSGIFQFETLEYQDYQNEGGVTNIVSPTFMKNEFTDTDGTTRSYQSVFMEAGQTYGISPYHLASRCAQEQGNYGTSQSISGTVPGLENYFNYFNIGAYAAAGRTATINGLYYAAGADENFLRPWNSRYKSIMGAAKYISTKYVSLGQNTLYFQKFNVVNKTNGIYSHQYMSNIVAASAESARLRKAYSDLNTTLVFRIPYYSNMPSYKCAKPTSDSNPNTYLSSLSLEGYEFTTPFSSVTNLYYVNVDQSVESVNVTATAVSGSSSVAGTGTIPLNMGDNKIQVTCKAQNGSSKIYTIMVRRGQ